VLDTLPAADGSGRLIHADFDLDNLVWHGEFVHILDFDSSIRCWPEADIAFAVRDLVVDPAGLAAPPVRWFIDGYAAHHPIGIEAVARLPTFARLAAALTYAGAARAINLDPGPEHPERLHGLTGKLRTRIGAYHQSLPEERP